MTKRETDQESPVVWRSGFAVLAPEGWEFNEVLDGVDMSAISEVHQLKAQVKVFQQEAAVLRLRVAELEQQLAETRKTLEIFVTATKGYKERLELELERGSK